MLKKRVPLVGEDAQDMLKKGNGTIRLVPIAIVQYLHSLRMTDSCQQGKYSMIVFLLIIARTSD